jgi:cation transport ATPase
MSGEKTTAACGRRRRLEQGEEVALIPSGNIAYALSAMSLKSVSVVNNALRLRHPQAFA